MGPLLRSDPVAPAKEDIEHDVDGQHQPECHEVAVALYPRPSAAGDGWDTLSTYGSNLGPEDPDLIKAIKERQREIAAREGVPVDQVPADAVTTSASGIDPDISPAYAALQVSRVARANGLSKDTVAALVAEHTDGRTFGFLGEPRVNVLELNIAVRAERVE